MLKRIVGLVVGTTVACSSFMAFAAEVDTTSTYVAGTDKISVASRVTGVSENQTLTYLAYDKSVEDLADLDGTNIVYIDQVTLASDMEDFDELTSTYTFRYTADTTDIQANVKIGGDAGTSTNPDVIDAGDCDVKIDGTSVGNVKWVADDQFVSIKYNAHLVDKFFVDGEELTFGTEWYRTVDGFIKIIGSYVKQGTLELTSTKTAETENGYVHVETTGIAWQKSDDSLIIIGESLGDVVEYGIVTQLEDGSNVHMFPALSRGTNGKFAVKIEGISHEYPAGTKVIAKAYYKTAEGNEYSTHNQGFVTIGTDADVVGNLAD